MSAAIVKENTGILLIVPQPKEDPLKLSKKDEDLFRESLGLEPGSKRVKTVYVVEEDLPSTVEESAIIVAGSADHVYDPKPWMTELERFLCTHRHTKPMLGVCFGHQIIAQAMAGGFQRKGQVVEAMPLRELGVTKIKLTEAGVNDPLFRDMPESFYVAMSHIDVVLHPPQESVMLAENQFYDNQALGYGPNIRTVQFHPEATTDILLEIIRRRKDAILQEGYITSKYYPHYMLKVHRTKLLTSRIIKNFYQYFVLPQSLSASS